MDTIRLKPNEIHFFYSLVEEIKDPLLLDRYRLLISEKEKAKTDRYVFEKDRHNCLITRSLLRFVLSICTGMAPREIEFIENAYGKPDLKPGGVPMPLRFNLSHSGGMTACALTLDHEIGVDIEHLHRNVDLSLADRYFTKSEAAYVRNRPVEERQAAFFDIWTLKESYIKAKGMGLSIELNAFGFTIDQETRIFFDPSLDDAPNQWRFFRFSPVEKYKAAISVKSPMQNAFNLRVYQCIPFAEIKPVDLDAQHAVRRA